MSDAETQGTSASSVGAGSVAAAGADAAAGMVWVCRSATLPHAEYRFYRALLLDFPERGGPPDRPTLRHLARGFGVDLEATLARLATHDLVQRDPTSGAITAAYPFSGPPKPHRVTLLSDPGGSMGVQVYAMCALDALGIPLMLRRPALVASLDPVTGERVRVRVWPDDAADSSAESGLPGWRAEWEPASALVYARPEDTAADPCDIACACRCPVTNFFTVREHARQWAEQHGTPGDVMLLPTEALPRADRRFGGLLDRLPPE